MSRYRFELASADDDADLRAILAATPMPGMISVGFRREPSFFAASKLEGALRQIVACRDLETGKLIGFGCRSVRDRFVNGKVEPIGYLGTLRLLAEHRNHGLVARGYRRFKELHGDQRTLLYLTTIAEDNAAALRVLTAGRAGLPVYHDAGRFHTALVNMRRAGKIRPTARAEIRPATRDDLPRLIDFWREVGPRRQFFPCYSEADFVDEDGAFAGLRLDDILLAQRDDKILGTIAGWDQRAYRQTVVHGYARPLGWFRGVYNLWSRLRGWPGLPAPGSRIRLLSAALTVVRDDDAHLFADLLHALCAKARGSAYYLAVGLHNRDRLLSALQRFPARTYATRLFHVCWEDGETFRHSLDDRPPYLELGTL